MFKRLKLYKTGHLFRFIVGNLSVRLTRAYSIHKAFQSCFRFVNHFFAVPAKQVMVMLYQTLE